jgi:hypothetical protein
MIILTRIRFILRSDFRISYSDKQKYNIFILCAHNNLYICKDEREKK